MTRFLEPTRERFLLAIAASLPAERFLELYFFAPIRQGGVESGVAVIAAHPEHVGCHPEERSEEGSAPIEGEQVQIPRFARNDTRYTVYTAKYKLVLKGPDRGKWDCRVVAEADAPLVTVETVVQGVQRRSGDADEAERMSGDEARDHVLAATR
jgi:hypothetical protein